MTKTPGNKPEPFWYVLETAPGEAANVSEALRNALPKLGLQGQLLEIRCPTQDPASTPAAAATPPAPAATPPPPSETPATDAPPADAPPAEAATADATDAPAATPPPAPLKVTPEGAPAGVPGFFLLKMIWNPQVWTKLRAFDGVTGFLGEANVPVPVADNELAFVTRQMGRPRKTKKVIRISGIGHDE